MAQGVCGRSTPVGVSFRLRGWLGTLGVVCGQRHSELELSGAPSRSRLPTKGGTRRQTSPRMAPRCNKRFGTGERGLRAAERVGVSHTTKLRQAR